MPVVCIIYIRWISREGALPDTLSTYISVGFCGCRPTIDGQCEKPQGVGRQQIQIPTLLISNLTRADEGKTEAAIINAKPYKITVHIPATCVRNVIPIRR